MGTKNRFADTSGNSACKRSGIAVLRLLSVRFVTFTLYMQSIVHSPLPFPLEISGYFCFIYASFAVAVFCFRVKRPSLIRRQHDIKDSTSKQRWRTVCCMPKTATRHSSCVCVSCRFLGAVCCHCRQARVWHDWKHARFPSI